MSPAGKMLFDSIAQMNERFVTGMKLGAEAERKKIAAILAAYDNALCDPRAAIPTYLHATIESARK